MKKLIKEIKEKFRSKAADLITQALIDLTIGIILILIGKLIG